MHENTVEMFHDNDLVMDQGKGWNLQIKHHD